MSRYDNTPEKEIEEQEPESVNISTEDNASSDRNFGRCFIKESKHAYKKFAKYVGVAIAGIAYLYIQYIILFTLEERITEFVIAAIEFSKEPLAILASVLSSISIAVCTLFGKAWAWFTSLPWYINVTAGIIVAIVVVVSIYAAVKCMARMYTKKKVCDFIFAMGWLGGIPAAGIVGYITVVTGMPTYPSNLLFAALSVCITWIACSFGGYILADEIDPTWSETLNSETKSTCSDLYGH